MANEENQTVEQSESSSAEKQQEVQNAQAHIAMLEQQKRMLTDRLSQESDENYQRGIQTVLNDVNARISGAKGALQKLVSAADLVKTRPGAERAATQQSPLETTSQEAQQTQQETTQQETQESQQETTQDENSANSTNKTSTGDKIIAAAGLIKQIPGADKVIAKATDKVASAVDKFLEKYGNKKFEVVKTPKFSLTFPLGIPLITISGSAQLVLSAELASKRTGATITSQATLSGVFTGQIGVAVGIKILGKQIGIEGGISVSASAVGKSVITLSIAGTDLSASMNPADIEITASAALYLKWSFGKPINWGVNKLVDKFVVPNLKGSNRKGNQLNYPLGSMELLIIKTPVYSLTFSIAQGRFSASKTGSFSCRIHPKLKARFDALKKGFRK